MARRKMNGWAAPQNRTSEGHFAPGVSGNPGGRPKGLRDFREALEAADVPERMVQVLLRGLSHEDAEIALAAYDRAAAYLYGRPGSFEVTASAALPVMSLEEARRLHEQTRDTEAPSMRPE